MDRNSKLDIILGPMFSGKTTKLLEIMEAFDKEDIKYIAVKPNIDNRYTTDNNNFLVSHNLKKKECKVVSNLKNIYNEISSNKTIESTRSESIDYVIIDEAHSSQAGDEAKSVVDVLSAKMPEEIKKEAQQEESKKGSNSDSDYKLSLQPSSPRLLQAPRLPYFSGDNNSVSSQSRRSGAP